jgi:hypothetical protein
VLAGLAAEGLTEVDDIWHVDRGYEQMERRLDGLGAEVSRIGATPIEAGIEEVQRKEYRRRAAS